MYNDIQTFRLFNEDIIEWVPFEDNINRYDKDIIKSKMIDKLKTLNWPTENRYVALGSYGDCVIYDPTNSNSIKLVSDSQ
jgi:hypothetical protein